MTGSEKWLQVLTEHVREIEPNDGEVAGILARSALDQPRAVRWRRTSRFNLVLAAFVALLLMTAVAVASGLVSPGAIVPGGDNSSSPQVSDSRPSEGPGAPSNPTQRDRAGAPVDPSNLRGPEERKGAKAVQDLYDGLTSTVEAGIPPLTASIPSFLDDAANVPGLIRMCESMSSAARKEAIDYVRITARRSDVRWTCEKAVALLIRRVKVGGDLKPVLKAKVLAVNVDGKRATATLQFDKDEPTTSVPLVKEQGEWKIGALPPGATGSSGGD